MCTSIMVCHGDMIARPVLKDAYSPEQRVLKEEIASMKKEDCSPATFYVTQDGQYAVDADFVSLADLNDPNFDINSVPKIKLSGD